MGRAGSPRSIATSTAMAPLSLNSNGRISIPFISGISITIWDRVTSVSQTERMSCSGFRLYSFSSLYMWVRCKSSRASTMFRGGKANCRSVMTLTLAPPAPHTTSGPNTGSRVTPTLKSMPPMCWWVDCTAKPRKPLWGKCRRYSRNNNWQESRIASSSFRRLIVDWYRPRPVFSSRNGWQLFSWIKVILTGPPTR